MAASSTSPVVKPCFGCMPATPKKNRSAEIVLAPSAAAAPQAAAERFSSRPAKTKRSTVGWLTRAEAMVGQWVIMVASRLPSRAAATANAVVPLSRLGSSYGVNAALVNHAVTLPGLYAHLPA